MAVFSFRKIGHRCIVCVTQSNWVKYAFRVLAFLPGSAEAQVIWGGILKRLLIAYFISNIFAKKYQNPFMCVKVIASQRFFETRCSARSVLEALRNALYKFSTYLLILLQQTQLWNSFRNFAFLYILPVVYYIGNRKSRSTRICYYEGCEACTRV